MTDPTPRDRPRNLLRAALVHVFGQPCRKQYALWSLAGTIGVVIFLALWRLSPVAPRQTMHGRKEPCLHAVSSASNLLATSESADFPHRGPIHLWDLQTGQRRLSVVGDWAAVRKVEFSPQGKLLTVIDQDDHMTLWETATGKEVARFVEFEKKGWTIPLETKFSPDDCFLILQDRHPALQDSDFLIFWNVESKAVRARIEGDLSDLTIAKDGKEMALSRQVERQHIRVERWRLDDGFPDAGPFQKYDVIAHEVAISPKLYTFASSRASTSPDKGDEIQLWDLATGKEKAKVVYLNPDPSNFHLRFSPNGRFLTVDNPGRFGWIRSTTIGLPLLWDTGAGLKEVGTGLNALHISADDRWLLALSKSHKVELYDTATFQKRGTISVPGDGIFAIAMGQAVSPTVWDLYQFTPDSTKVLVTRMDHYEKTNPVTDFLGEHIPGFKPKGLWWVSRLWDVETARQIATFTECGQADCSSDGKTLVTAHEDGTIKLWDIPPRKPILAILGLSLVLWFALLFGVPLSIRLVRRIGFFAVRSARPIRSPTAN
jgi:WD40 repeat protein